MVLAYIKPSGRPGVEKDDSIDIYHLWRQELMLGRSLEELTYPESSVEGVDSVRDGI